MVFDSSCVPAEQAVLHQHSTSSKNINYVYTVYHICPKSIWYAPNSTQKVAEQPNINIPFKNNGNLLQGLCPLNHANNFYYICIYILYTQLVHPFLPHLISPKAHFSSTCQAPATWAEEAGAGQNGGESCCIGEHPKLQARPLAIESANSLIRTSQAQTRIREVCQITKNLTCPNLQERLSS